MNENTESSPKPQFSTRVFDSLKAMQEEIKRQNIAMGWYDGMGNKFSTDVQMAVSSLRSESCHELADAIENLNKEYERLLRERLFSNCCMNLVGEVAEMFESFRSGKLKEPCDKAEKMAASEIPVLTAEEEEIADVLIRTLDYAGRFGVDIARAVEAKHRYNRTRGYRHGNKKA